jgi:hypothetical protein
MTDSWFSPTLKYDGKVHAEFADPAGSVDCHGEATVNETGDCALSMVVRREEIATSEDLQCGVRQFVTGERPHHVCGQTYLTLSPTRGNPCKSIRLKTDDGTLAVIRFRHARCFDVPGVEDKDEMRIELQVDEMRFVSRRAVQTKYFAIPLLNFISDFLPTGRALAGHPLRLRSASQPSLINSGVDSEAIPFGPEPQHRGILFEFNGLPAFVQPVQDYDEKAESLTRRKAEAAVTAVLVGEVASPADWPDDLTKWSAVRLVPALSFATGTFVGTTWAEFRDAEAGLVARHHRCFGRRAFETGHRTIIEKFDRGIGPLLALTAKALGTGNIDPTMAMQYATKAGLSERMGLEDKLRAVANAVECLWLACSCDEDLLIGSLNTNVRESVKEFAETAARGIDELASSLQATADVGPAKIAEWQKGLKAVAGTIRAAPDRRKSDFGSKVIKLLEKHGLGDATFADAHYGSSGTLSGKMKSWEQMIRKYRNKADHLGYFDFAAGRYSLLQVKGVADHLHDIVIRIILKAIGYTGYRRTYQTPLCPSLTSVPVEWVTAQTLSNMLGGYEA